ncbi:low molecular weight phosphotyrosine protein phosphatase 1 [Diabrotica virgifera virgifera]|uniref:Low molecular weight phosphotyrosine protein phosphatase n=1 Tax=Diabrotica virgifera virgifera TaxID=50390 RepID=A0A6P7FPA4_DIAVI|nr:low molecular weight phosphotyrosine protein phosphatase 1 [Diabrotica virgifera virgifera]
MVQKVLFICLGNICRSPIAEAVFQHLVNEKGVAKDWIVDSAAIGSWHIGKQPDSRARQTLKNHGVQYNGRARQIQKNDFNEFDYIFGMDEDNMSDLESRAPKGSKAKRLLLGEFDPQGERIIRDPYYDDGSEGFEKCYQQCLRACGAFLEQNS